MTHGARAITDPWRIATPHDAARWFSNVDLPWWIAGGWALDLFAGERTRNHKDLDIGVLRRHAPHVVSALVGWEAFEAKDGILKRLPAGKSPRADVNSLWCRPAGTGEWALELMLDDGDEDFWIYRRDPSIRMALPTAIRKNAQGISYLAPEIQL